MAPKVLIIDEMGLSAIGRAGRDDLLSTSESARYERGSIILTSNKSYGDWGSIFGDPIIATAILDRPLHHPTTINIRRESYRLKDSGKLAFSRELSKRTTNRPPFPQLKSCRTVLAVKGPLRRAKPTPP